MRKGLIQFDFTMIFQLMNTLLLLALVYAIIRYIVKTGKEKKATIQKLETIEKKIEALEKCKEGN
ncbi:hypothetical protein [Fusibacter sp. JL216-2]|uniref:hypothetical protein n=1 Tax=Fusibacter sp. JL216-2 TaxID=3071453 RepID=UPI003D348CBC